MREWRYGTEMDIGYLADYRFSVRLTDYGGERKFQAYARDLNAKKDIEGPVCKSRKEAEDFAEAWKDDYIRTGNIYCIERPRV